MLFSFVRYFLPTVFVIDPNNNDWAVSYKLTFTNENDGIQEYSVDKKNQSEYFWPYEAPADGYQKEINWSAYYQPDGWAGIHKSDRKENRKYIYRVRTRTDQKGNIIEAKYGRLIGDIILSFNGYTGFVYFFNPTGNRSLEYDSKSPLFKWSKKDLEHVVSGP